MRKYPLLLMVLLCIYGSLDAQLITKLPVANETPTITDSIPDPLIIELNKLITAFNNQPSTPTLQSVIDFLKKNTSDTSKSFSSRGDSVLQHIYQTRAEGFAAIDLTPLPEEKIAIQKAAPAGNCPRLAIVAALK